MAVVEELWDIFAAQPAHNFGNTCMPWNSALYVEHEGCSMSFEFKFGTCVKTT
jgi:hypothetical protein